MSGSRLMAVSASLATMALAIVPTPALAQRSYDWTLDCNGDGFASVGWNWTEGGALIPGAGGTAICYSVATLNGTGDRPANADGFTAHLGISGPCYSARCSDSDSVTKSFDLAKSFGTKLAVHFVGRIPGDCGFSAISPESHCLDIHLSGSAKFAVNS